MLTFLILNPFKLHTYTSTCISRSIAKSVCDPRVSKQLSTLLYFPLNLWQVSVFFKRNDDVQPFPPIKTYAL